MVKIIQMSIILMYDVVGRLWLMPMKLAGKIQLVPVYKLVNVIHSVCSLYGSFCSTQLNLQGGQDKHHCEVDLDDHGEELVGEHIDQLAQEHQHPSWQGHLVKQYLNN